VTYQTLLRSNRDFRWLWIGQVVSEIGDWLNNIAVLAITIQAAGAGREGLAISLYAVARHLPLFTFGPLAGVIVDRRDRRRVMIAADVARALLAVGFLLARPPFTLPVIYLVGAGLFSISAFFNAAKRASIPNLVNGPDQLLTANSLSASTTAATIAVGSALGGIAATLLGKNFVFILNAATFLISAIMISLISGPTRRRDPDSTVAGSSGTESIPLADDIREIPGNGGTVRKSSSWRSALSRAVNDFRDGLRYVRNVDIVYSIFVVAAFWGLGNGVARALYSLFGARLGLESASTLVDRPVEFGISVLFVAMGIGGVLGAPVARRFNSAAGASLGDRMGRSLLFDGCGLFLFSFLPGLWAAAAILVAREVNFAIWWTAQQTLLMTSTDDRFSGRVFASFETITTLAMVASMLMAGAAADGLGIRPVAAGGGAMIIFAGALWFILSSRQGRRSREISLPPAEGC
jgi:predicted MFS family arabinose efflux permease